MRRSAWATSHAVELIRSRAPAGRPVAQAHESQPQVVHFSSHGSPDEIILESGDDEAVLSDPFGRYASTDERDCMLKLWDLAPGHSDTLLLDTTPASSTAARRRNFRPHALEFTLAER